MHASKPGLLLSLIVPVYNVAQFLPRCLESLSTESAATTEIVLVDDGSTDACPQLLDEFAATHAVATVIHQKNAGLSGARNTGIENARGQYIAFVDSDDYYDPGYYMHLVRLCEDNALDMAIGNATYHFEGRQPDQVIFTDAPPTGVIRGRDLLCMRLRDRTMLHMVWMHVYRRAMIEAHHLRFVPRLIHEDVPWTTRILLLANRVMYDPTPGYHYRQPIRRYAPVDLDRRLTAVIDSAVYNARDLASLADELDTDQELQHLLRWQLTDGALSIFHKLGKINDRKLRSQIYHDLRENGVFRLLWQNAVEDAQRRRIARNWLKSWFV